MDSTIFYSLGSVYFLLGILKFLYSRQVSKKTEIPYSTDELANIKKLEQKEPSNKPPVILSGILLISSFFLLAIAILAIWLWFSGEVAFNFDISIMFFAVAFVLFPVAVIIDTFFIEPKRFKLGRSFVSKEANVDFNLDVGEGFNRCLSALTNIHANIIKFNRPKYIIALIDKSKFTISLRRTRDNRSKANIICDNQWLTVKFDMGKNRKYLNQFLKAL